MRYVNQAKPMEKSSRKNSTREMMTNEMPNLKGQPLNSV